MPFSATTFERSVRRPRSLLVSLPNLHNRCYFFALFRRAKGRVRHAAAHQVDNRQNLLFFCFSNFFLEREHLTPCFCGEAYSFIPRGLSIGLVGLWLCIQGVILSFFKDLHWLPTKCVLSPTSMRSSWIH